MDHFKNQPLSWLHGFTNNSLHLILFMTEQCNFRCVYCYEDFKLGNMKAEVLEGVKNLVTKRIPELQYLGISYFGGEPLLNKTALIDVTRWANELCAKNGTRYAANITTNGYSLDEKTFTTLFENGITEYQITLDGDKSTHDKLRPTINGKGTFEKIWENIQAMSRTPLEFSCVIRLNVSDANFDGAADFVKQYAAPLFLADKRFKLHFHPIWGKPELVLKQKDRLKELNDLVKALGLEHTAESALTELNTGKEEKEAENAATKKGRDADYICYAAKPNSFSIRADGKIQKCTVALDDDINTIGHLNQDGSMQLDQDKMRKWVFSQEKGCPLQAFAKEKIVIPYENAGKFEIINQAP